MNLSNISEMKSYHSSTLSAVVAAESGDSNSPTEIVGQAFDHQSIKKFLLRPGRALMNPFDPTQTTVKKTSNRRRWTHIFPMSPAQAEGTSNVEQGMVLFNNKKNHFKHYSGFPFHYLG